MIRKGAVTEYLNKELRDYQWVKELKRDELWSEVKPFMQKRYYRFKTKPYLHQLACFYLGIFIKAFIFQLDMGLGKTKIVLDILWYRRLRGQVYTTIVLVPEVLHVQGWEDEVAIHSFFDCYPLYENTEQKWQTILKRKQGVYVMTYHAAFHMVAKLVKKKGEKKGKMVVNKQLLIDFANQFDAVVFDECHGAKDYNSLTFRMCNALTNHLRIRYGLTGTLFGRDPTDCWSQFFMIDKGETLGETLGILRAAFFNEGSDGWGRTYEFRKDRSKKFHKRLQNRSLRYSDEEVGDVPKKKQIQLTYNFADRQVEHYIDAVNGVIKAGGDLKACENSFIKMRQICSGYIQWKEEGETQRIVFKENPKLDLTHTWLAGLPEEASAVLFYEFNPSGDMLLELLQKMGVSVSIARGGKYKKDVPDQVRKFKRGENRILLANWKSAAEGGNFQIAQYMGFYESPVSPIKRRQCLKRIHRLKQTKRTYMYDFVAVGRFSVERKILEYIEEGESLFSALVEGRVKQEELLC